LCIPEWRAAPESALRARLRLKGMPTKTSLHEGPPAGSGLCDSADSFLREVAAVSEERDAPTPLREGDVLADRFVIERLAGHGGMGTVYRALDRTTGGPIALKLIAGGGQHDERFAREARVLSELIHPSIVRYVAHGTGMHRRPFLAMEWLEGEDLAQRLARAGLTAAESVAVAIRVADGLAAAHARGLVHRDVKPSNVFLVGGDPTRAKLLDFGIVRLQLAIEGLMERPVTRTGTVLGTAGYMSPEQAIADRALDARTDIFALGCLLFECLTGTPTFTGAHVVAVLAKVLREEAPRVRNLRPDLPPALDELVARMLSKDKAGRPADGVAVREALAQLGSLGGGVPEVSARSSPGLSGGEQRLVSLILALVADEPERVRAIAQRHGADLARLANGALLVTPSARGTTSEPVVTAAVCALELYQEFPAARIALAMGRAETTAGGAMGPVIDQAASLLAHSTSSGILIDEVTAGLLGERFEVRQEEKCQVLVGRKSDGEAPRTLLGKPTPCVGRDKELSLLELTLRECVEESVARAVVVTGPAGQGKSRLRYEFVKRARERGEVAILMARADPVGAGSAFMMVRQLVRQAVGLREGDPAPEQHIKLRAHVADVCKHADFARIADFLGELISIPSTEHPSPQLRAARNDPQVMATWLGRSFGEWLAAECAARPLAVILEDLHWGDLPSVTYLSEGLRALAAKPFMVLGLARPEVDETFPNLWAGAEIQRIALGRLVPRAAERLVKAALGDKIAEDAVSRVVERADGNAFYLEELIRRVHDGGGDTLPDTVIALVESRLERLEPAARRIVRAASVFGEVFWRGGVASLLGAEAASADVREWLEVLREREVISAAADSRFSGDREYVFRHGLLREAAYAMLTEGDRATGHRLAGDWLERAGEKDALTMADHFEKGGEPRRAIRWLVQGAQTALGGGNVGAAIALGHRGIACGAVGLERATLRQVQGTALIMGGDLPASVDMLREAMGFLEVGSTPWFLSAAGVFSAGAFLGDPNVTAPVLQEIMTAPVEPEPSGPYGLAVYATCVGLNVMGQLPLARSFLKRAEDLGRRVSEPDLVFVMYLLATSSFLDVTEGRLGVALANSSESHSLADRAGDALGRASAGMLVVQVLGQTGHWERAEAAFRDLRSFCEPRGFGFYSDWGALHLALGAVLAHRVSDAIESLSTLQARRDRLLAATARAYLAQALVQAGDLDGAVREATTAIEGKLARTAASGALALVELRRGRPAEALAFAERGLASDARAPWPSNGSMLRLARAEALHALGRHDDAHTAIRDARHRVLEVASTLDGDPELRASYLTNVGVSVRTLGLAAEWLGEA
jgi:hypothetical protein